MEKAIAALGATKALNQCMHIGPHRHLLHFPVADQKLLNVVAFDSDPSPWTREDGRLIAPATRKEVVDAFRDWNRPVRAITEMFPETSEKWAVFDSYEYPVPFYSKGRVCLAGDAAHSAAPHHGAGAGAGVEDVLCLVTAISKASDMASPSSVCATAFSIYDSIRYERTQWLVQSSHEVCEMYELNHAVTKDDITRFKEEVEARSHKIWYFDYEDMVKRTLAAVKESLGRGQVQVML